MSRSSDTKTVYRFEKFFLYPGAPDLPMRTLRSLAQRIWRENTWRRDQCPTIVAGDGLAVPGQTHFSYCEGRSRIVLARHQRNRHVLIHEMVHALGPLTHGKRFQVLYAELLAKYL